MVQPINTGLYKVLQSMRQQLGALYIGHKKTL